MLQTIVSGKSSITIRPKFYFHVQSCSIMPVFPEVIQFALTGMRIWKWHKKWHKTQRGVSTNFRPPLQWWIHARRIFLKGRSPQHLPRQHASGQDTEPEAGAWQGWVSDLNFSESGWWCRILSSIEIEMYHVSHQGQQFGPYTVEQINEYLAQGAFDASSHVWDANANGWIET